jgi:hypothetical protein
MLTRIQEKFGIKVARMDLSTTAHATSFDSPRQIKATELLELHAAHPTRLAVDRLVDWDRKLYAWLHDEGIVATKLHRLTRCRMDGTCDA